MSRKVTHTASSLARRLHRRTPSAAMLVAGVALSVALAGTASAALDLSKGDALIAKHSLSGNRLRNHSVTGAQIRVNTLGKVPSALNADHARIAVSADAAQHALSADTAGRATAADNATHANTADTANGLPALHWVNLTLTNNWVAREHLAGRAAAGRGAGRPGNCSLPWSDHVQRRDLQQYVLHGRLRIWIPPKPCGSRQISSTTQPARSTSAQTGHSTTSTIPTTPLRSTRALASTA